VSNPLDTTKFEQNPCGLLSQARAGQVANLVSTRMSAGAAGPICQWSDTSHNGVAFGLIHGNGLSDAYQSQDSAGYFVPVPNVAGYPAIFGSVSDGRSMGVCTMVVGVRNDEVMTVSSSFGTSSPYNADPCPVVQKAAEAAIATLKGGS
jgi:hypothetical protein